MCTTPLHPQWDGMVKRCIRTVDEHLRIAPKGLGRKITHHPPLLTGHLLTTLWALLRFRLPCDMLFGAPPDKERPTIDHMANLVDRLHDIYSYASQNLKLASDRIKTRYDRLTNCAGYREGNKIWLYRSTPHEREIAQAPILRGGHIQGSHSDK
jgi:hypothetical protein